MKSLIVSTFDISGGAARAAYRLHQGLQGINVNSQMLVQYKDSDDDLVSTSQNKLEEAFGRLKPTLDDLPLKLKRNLAPCAGKMSLQWTSDSIRSKVRALNPEVVNLHWTSGYMRIESLSQIKQPIVWTLHDMWAFTGGCHYTQGCSAYSESCGSCPIFKKQRQDDLSHWVWQRKAKAWRNLNLTVVAPSQWLANCAQKSSLFQNTQVHVIPNSLDTNIYKPLDRKIARSRLNLPADKKIILFGAASPEDKRKGFHLLNEALVYLSEFIPQEELELAIFGTSKPYAQEDLKFKPHYLGSFRDDVSLAMLYAAADVFIAPSTQDNLPNTVMEALACGTPCVAFNVGGMPDMIEHEQNGFLAKPFDVDDLANGIYWVISDKDRYLALHKNAHRKAKKEFHLKVQADRYSQLFANLVESSTCSKT